MHGLNAVQLSIALKTNIVTNKCTDEWGFGYLIVWFVGGTGCTLQTLYAWLMRGFGMGMVGILIYRVLHLSLRCDSWYARYVINLVK